MIHPYLVRRAIATLGFRAAQTLGLVAPDAQPTAEQRLADTLRSYQDTRRRNQGLQVEACRNLERPPAVTPWGWLDFDHTFGGLVAGWLTVIGGRPGSGKTTLLLNLLDSLWSARVPTLYLGTETAAAVLVTQWAALRAGIPILDVFEGRLNGQQPALTAGVTELMGQDQVTFSQVTRLDLSRLSAEIVWAYEARKGPAPKVIILDHLHRVTQDREELEQLAQELKSLATERDCAMVVAAQLNRDTEQRRWDLYTPPSMGRYKGSAAIEENADVGLGLYRPLKLEVGSQQRRAVDQGRASLAELVDVGVLACVCTKHRWRGDALNQTVRLRLADGRLRSLTIREPPWNAGDAWEPTT